MVDGGRAHIIGRNASAAATFETTVVAATRRERIARSELPETTKRRIQCTVERFGNRCFRCELVERCGIGAEALGGNAGDIGGGLECGFNAAARGENFREGLRRGLLGRLGLGLGAGGWRFVGDGWFSGGLRLTARVLCGALIACLLIPAALINAE